MGARFNPPPGWPRPPAGWTPPPGWQPDPSWGPPPPGWPLWVQDAPRRRGSPVGWVMVVLPTLSCGLASFVPPLWAAVRRRHDRRFGRLMYAAAATLLGLVAAGLVLVASAPEGADGDPTGVRAEAGGVALVLCWLLGTALALAVRRTVPSEELPGVAAELERRRLREQYRTLAAGDPDLARSIGVGRPDLPRGFDDGGLVDLNHVDLGLAPGRLGQVTAEELRRLAEARAHLGRFSGLEEAAVYAALSDTAVEGLRERAVFL